MRKKQTFNDFLTSGSGSALLIAALAFALVSVLLFWFAAWLARQPGFWGSLSGPLGDTARLILTVGGLQFLLRTKIWKDAIESVGDRIQAKQAALDAGLVHYWTFDAVPWEQLFSSSTEVTVVAISARPLLVQRLATVREFLSRSHTKLRLVLADFRAADLMARYDAEFNEIPGTRATKLKEALGELLKALDDENGEQVEFFLSPSRVPYSAYVFDEQMLFVPYLAEPVRDARRIPAMLFSDGGIANSYLRPDLKYLLGKNGLSRAEVKDLLEQHETASPNGGRPTSD